MNPTCGQWTQHQAPVCSFNNHGYYGHLSRSLKTLKLQHNWVHKWVPVAHKEWMNKRPWSLHFRIWPSWPVGHRGNWRLISTTNTTAQWREGGGMVIPTVVIDVHGRKSIRRRHLTWNWWPIPLTIETRPIRNTPTGIWWRGVNWSKVSNIWAMMSGRWYTSMLSKDRMLSKKIMIYIKANALTTLLGQKFLCWNLGEIP